VGDSYAALSASVPAQAIAVQATGLTTRQANPALQGKANIFVGTTTVPYYLRVATSTSDAAVLTSSWTAAGASPAPGIDPASRFITRFNPIPLKTADAVIPLLVTVPNATAAGGAGCPRPTAGYPAVIVQHGLGGNRSQALAIADSFADACFIVAAIDIPLHGITDTTNPFYQAGRERTFNLDVINNTNSAPGPDGRIDASGGNFIQIPSALTSRDNLRQAQVDTIVFGKSLTRLDVTGDGVADVDPARVHFVGLSLGGIVGAAHARYAAGTRTATLAVPGGLITQLLLDSPTFGPSIKAGLSAQGLTEGTTLFNTFFRDIQNVVDTSDPVNHIAGANVAKPIHLVQVVGDTVVPNSATQRMVTAAGLRRLSAAGPTAVAAGTGAWVNFIAGSHGTLFDPTASLAATVEMQSQTVQFAASAVAPGGPFVVITNTAVLQP
jgi:dienelactone hydrolase